MQKARTHVAAAADAGRGSGRAASRIAARLCRGKVMYLSLQCLQWHVKLCSERGEWREREVGHACMCVFVCACVCAVICTSTALSLRFFNGIFRACTSDPNSLRNYDSVSSWVEFKVSCALSGVERERERESENEREQLQLSCILDEWTLIASSIRLRVACNS